MSEKLFKLSKKYYVGGVNSPVRAFKSVGGAPIFIKKGKGSKIFSIDNKSFTDYSLQFGSLILGHLHPEILNALKTALENGTGFGMPTEIEIEFAKELISSIPFIERLRILNSGTEATMTAVRVARAFTGKRKIIKFDGCYHGHFDSFLIKAGSGATTFGVPNSKGVPEELASLTISCPFNDFDYLEKIVKKNKKEIAAVILEPIPANMGVILPKKDFLKNISDLCNQNKIILIFDEIITGFRISNTTYSNLIGIKPDLICLGKIIGGGLPIGILAGKKEIMDLLSPVGNVYQAGTFSANPLTLTAGITTLKLLKKLDYNRLNSMTEYLCSEIEKFVNEKKINLRINRIGSMWTFFFTDKEVVDYKTALTSDTKMFSKYFHSLLKAGIFFPPSQFEACFLSFSHSQKDIENLISVTKKILGGD